MQTGYNCRYYYSAGQNLGDFFWIHPYGILYRDPGPGGAIEYGSGLFINAV